MDVAYAQLSAQFALLDGLRTPEAEGDVGIGKFILNVDDGAQAVASDGIDKTFCGHMAAAVDPPWLDDAQQFVRVIAAAIIDERSDDEEPNQSCYYAPADYACHPFALLAPPPALQAL